MMFRRKVQQCKRSKKIKRDIVVFGTIAVFIFILYAGMAMAVKKEDLTHLNKSKNKRGCAACHDASGKGKTGMMLRDQPVELCFRCHGPTGTPEERAMTNIFSLITKRSKHPIIETARYHAEGEDLPEQSSAMPRHVSCLDCHNVHRSKPGHTLAGAKGVNAAGFKRGMAEKVSEVCYNCHSDSRNLPYSSSNIRLQFDPSNRSYHPVERVAAGRSPSLQKDIRQGSLISCTDCHDPHGSDYPPLLRVNYNLNDGGESTYAYELCYTCHDRNSILSNASFKGSPQRDYGHKEHIVYQQTSCHTCHASHGSSLHDNLIEFNPSVVSGMRIYIDYKGGRAQCNLTCHGKVHS